MPKPGLFFASWFKYTQISSNVKTVDHNNSLPRIAKRLDASLNRFFFAFGHYIPYPYYDPIYNILSGGEYYPARWYVGYNPVIPGIEEGHRQKPQKVNPIISPNPIVDKAVISYTIPTSGDVSLKLYSTDGRLVKILDQGYRAAGNYTSVIKGDGLPAGTNFLILEMKNYKNTHSLVLVH